MAKVSKNVTLREEGKLDLVIKAIETEYYRIPQAIFSGTELMDTTHIIEALDLIIVMIYTAEGVIGTGYSYLVGHGASAVKAMLDTELAPQALGRSCRDVDHIWETGWWRTHFAGRGGVSTLAIAALDIALWDALAKAVGLPLFRYIGVHRERISGYASAVNLSLSTDQLVEQVEESVKHGLQGYKLKVGRPRLMEDRDRIAAVREILGPEGLLLVDANMGWTLGEAVRRARTMEQHDVYWLEEPLTPEDVAGYAALVRATSIPIATGENLYSKYEFNQYFRSEAIHIVQADAVRCGSITEWLKIAHLAHTFGLQMAPHFLPELHVHLLCSIPNALILEFLPWFNALLIEPIEPKDGLFSPPNRPGHGILFNREKLAPYRLHCWSSAKKG